MHGLKRKVRRAIEQRWRKEKKRSVPSPSAVFRYLSEFHDAKQEKIREQSGVKAFIPASNEHLKGLRKINKDMCAGLNTVRLEKTATLDMDATIAATMKKVKLRSDTAGYQHELLKYCEKGEDKRFGRIEFAIGCNVTQAFRIAVA